MLLSLTGTSQTTSDLALLLNWGFRDHWCDSTLIPIKQSFNCRLQDKHFFPIIKKWVQKNDLKNEEGAFEGQWGEDLHGPSVTGEKA